MMRLWHTLSMPAKTVYCVLALYVAGFLIWPMNAINVTDESAYVAQAVAFAHGSATVPTWDPLAEAKSPRVPSSYPPGTSAMQAAFVLLGGWRAAALASLVAVCGTVHLLMKLLRSQGSDERFALMVLGYPPTLLLGRLAMSDVPSALVVTASLYLLCRSPRGCWVQLGAGLLAGLSLSFRETNVVPLAPFMAGSVIRREPGAWRLIVGAAIGAAIRPLVSRLLFGDWFFARPSSGFSLHALGPNAVLYAVALLVFYPAGIVGPLSYRGPRGPELRVSVALTVALFLFYNYSGAESGAARQLILGPRYFTPIVGMIAISCAEAFPRIVANTATRLPTVDVRRLARYAVKLWIASVAIFAIAVHPILWRWGARQTEISGAIYQNTSPGGVIVTAPTEGDKYINELYGDRAKVSRTSVTPSQVSRLVSKFSSVFLVFINRSDSEFRIWDASQNDKFVSDVREVCSLGAVYDRRERGDEVLRIWRVLQCR